MFYNKEVKLYKKEIKTDDYGISSENKVYITTLKADVQPYSKELLKKDYGINENCTKRMFCTPSSDIELNRTIEYDNKDYTIKTIVEWDNYWEVAIDDA